MKNNILFLYKIFEKIVKICYNKITKFRRIRNEINKKRET